jgi:hypothetical protein
MGLGIGSECSYNFLDTLNPPGWIASVNQRELGFFILNYWQIPFELGIGSQIGREVGDIVIAGVLRNHIFLVILDIISFPPAALGYKFRIVVPGL